MQHIVRFFTILCLSLIAWIPCAQAQEGYAKVQIFKPNGWHLEQMQTFSGAVPSRAWVFKNNNDNAEVLVSVMVTEGIIDGLPKQSLSNLMRLYLQSLIVGWNGKVIDEEKNEDKDDPEKPDNEIFCADGAGYQMTGIFGTREFQYYGCMVRAVDWSRIVTVSTWIPKGAPSQPVLQHLLLFLQAVTMPPPVPQEDEADTVIGSD